MIHEYYDAISVIVQKAIVKSINDSGNGNLDTTLTRAYLTAEEKLNNFNAVALNLLEQKHADNTTQYETRKIGAEMLFAASMVNEEVNKLFK